MASSYSMQQHPPRVPMIRTPSSNSMEGMSQSSHPIQSPTYQNNPNGPAQGQGQPQQQLQQQQQQVGQGQGQPQPQNGQQGQSQDGQIGAGLGGQGGQQMNLAGVLHYLQSEWRRWERDRNEWEIERAEMRARIALLEGERRSAENLKTDLMRRVKILEFALRQERSKTLNSHSGHTLQASSASVAAVAAAGLPASKLAAIVSGEGERGINGHGSRSQRGERPGSGGSSSPKSEGSNFQSPEINSKNPKLLNGNVHHPRTTNLHPAAAGSVAGSSSHMTSQRGPGIPGENAWKNSIVAPPRDVKSRAKSREYLKQCLQEISYLTSPAALNPLPTRMPLTLSIPSSLDGEASNIHPTLDVEPRPKKVLSDAPIPSAFPPSAPTTMVEQEAPPEPQPIEPEAKAETEPEQARDMPASQARPIPTNSRSNLDENERILTAIYRPESRDAWKEALRTAGEKAKESRGSSDLASDSGESVTSVGSDSLAHLKPIIEEEPPSSGEAPFVWKPSRQLKSHLEIVNGLAFGPNGTLVSGSSDCTVKVWRADMIALASGRPSSVPSELEPQTTFRGHTAPVTSVCVSKSRSLIFSGSMDSTVRVWHIPPSPPNFGTYSAYDPSLVGEVLVGHTDGVWGLSIIPSAEDAEGYLVSGSADGTCKVWSLTEESGFPLLSSWRYGGASEDDRSDADAAKAPVPVSIAANHSDLTKVLVGYDNGIIKSFDVRSGTEALKCTPEQSSTGEESAPTLNQVVSHPSASIVFSAMSDGTVRKFDSTNGTQLDSLKAHPLAVNSLDLDPTSSSALVTCGDDCSVKLWLIPNVQADQADDQDKPTCVQEWTLHRRKSEQGVMSVRFHDDLALMASGGADGVIRLYVKGSTAS